MQTLHKYLNEAEETLNKQRLFTMASTPSSLLFLFRIGLFVHCLEEHKKLYKFLNVLPNRQLKMFQLFYQKDSTRSFCNLIYIFGDCVRVLIQSISNVSIVIIFLLQSAIKATKRQAAT